MPAKLRNPVGPVSPQEDAGLADKVAQARAAVAALAEQFATLVQDDLAAIETAYAHAQDGKGHRMEHIRQIFDVSHNLKGQGSSFGYDLLTEVAHLLCVRTRDVGHVDDQALDSIGFHVKALRVIIDGQIRGKGGEKGEALLSKLTRLPGAGDEMPL